MKFEPVFPRCTPVFLILSVLGVILFEADDLSAAANTAQAAPESVPVRGPVALNQPITVYNNWSAYDELSDRIELTEALALKELNEILRLRRAGVRLDYYVMDAFWYSPTGGYRQFRQPHWPTGPDRWPQACRDNHLKPGLWVASNVPFRLEVLPEWRSSLDRTQSAMCLFDGGFLPQFIDTLQYWYDQGVRLFKFDFANFTIATPVAAARFSKEEVFSRNCAALRQALRDFKRRNPEVLLAAFNGFGGDMAGTYAPIRQTVDLRWLDTFDSLYCGDPRPSDVPAFNFWRSMDIYTDHAVRYYEANGVPLERIDNTGFMVGQTGTCYQRKTSAWKGMLILEHARGGWMNVYYGNLELLNDRDAQWFAAVQRLYLPLQSLGRTYTFGALPGLGEPYGFCSVGAGGSVYTVVNPSQAIRTISLPRVHVLQPVLRGGRLLFRDAGFAPKLSKEQLTLGPEQLAVVGYGEYAHARYALGVQDDVIIPRGIRSLAAEFHPDGTNSVTSTFSVPAQGSLRIVVQQFADGQPVRTSAGAPPNGTTLGKILRLEASQDGQELPVDINYDKAIWSGLSWAVGEIKSRDLKHGLPLTVRCSSAERRPVQLHVELYEVTEDK